MTVDFYIKQGDTRPPFEVTLLDANRDPVDLTTATVQFRMSTRAGAVPVIDEAATVVDAPNGVVAYQWGAGDTDTPGTYLAEFVVTTASQETFPNSRYLVVQVIQSLVDPTP